MANAPSILISLLIGTVLVENIVQCVPPAYGESDNVHPV